jgi:hypothetical protein
MNDFGTNPPDPNPEKPTAFCQNCGKPLTQDSARYVGKSVFCEPCLDARVHGARPVTDSGYAPVNAGPAPYQGQASAWSMPGAPAVPNPGLAFLLGLIPGVGAMYNEQYAKGLVHLTVFAFLVVLAHASGIFGLFIAGWVIYMAIEAHHTAQAKRDGLPLPNPFGLNDIGERMGFGPGWTTPQNVAAAARDAAQAAGFRPNPAATAADPAQPAPPPPQPGAWGAPVETYAKPYTTVPPPPAYTAPFTNQDWQPHAQPSYSQNYPPFGAPVPPYAPPFIPPVIPPMVPLAPRNRFPAGAIWLIGLGTIFLLGTEGIFSGLRGEVIVGILFLGLGAAVFARRITAFEDQMTSPQFRILYALRPSVWLGLFGLLFLLDSFSILDWSHSWPLFIILAGVMMLVNRAPFLTPVPYSPVASVQAGASDGDMTRLNLQPDPPASGSDSPSDHLTGGK